MGSTEVIAMLGAVTGTTGSVLGVMSYRRDRAKLVLRAYATRGLAPYADRFFLLHIEVANEGRHPATILQVKVLESRLRGLRTPLRMARLDRWRMFIARVGSIREIGEPLAFNVQPVVLAAGERKEYTLRANNFTARGSGGPARFTYVTVIDIRRRTVSKRVPMDGAAEGWDSN
jgi:hypothetical protein